MYDSLLRELRVKLLVATLAEKCSVTVNKDIKPEPQYRADWSKENLCLLTPFICPTTISLLLETPTKRLNAAYLIDSTLLTTTLNTAHGHRHKTSPLHFSNTTALTGLFRNATAQLLKNVLPVKSRKTNYPHDEKIIKATAEKQKISRWPRFKTRPIQTMF